ncbi:hypothetical protein C8Q72DRAFT_933312 [Fomitopsis betulina]|nr:hypothetical protein C8Q72DRAFT_933312 [Fomitopsis betulina]
MLAISMHFCCTRPHAEWDYVPSRSEFETPRPWTNPTKVFEAVFTSEQETDNYSYLIKGLTKVVSEFDDACRPRFAGGSNCAVRFPFKDWEGEHDYSLPGIVMSFPGESDHDDTWAQTWGRISMVFEVNPTDPMDESAPWPSVDPSMQAMGVLTQLAESARNLMMTHGMLFVFVVGIHGEYARIYRFDRAACVVSRAFNIKTHPWPLHELLGRVCHYEAPVGGLPTGPLVPRLLGEDPTLSRASQHDVDLADKKCKETGKHPLSEDERQACRWVTIAKHDSDGKLNGSARVLLYRVRFLNPQLFSRATVVSDGYEEHTWKRLVVKDAWRQVARDREDAFYDQIHESIQNRVWPDILDHYKPMYRSNKPCDLPHFPFGPYKSSAESQYDFPPDLETVLAEAELFGLVHMKHGDDLGEREVTKLACAEDGSYFWPPDYEFCHRTICRARLEDTNSEQNERSHMRLVFETVGRPLSQFKSTKELIRGLRDAIYGHRQAFRAGIIHCDISENNVMLSDDPMSPFVGFLLDFDYSFNWMEMLKRAGWAVTEESWKRYVEEYDRNLPKRPRPPPRDGIPPVGAANLDGMTDEAKADLAHYLARMKLKERTGTLYFMAIEILQTHVTHDVRHDLESFFWLLLWAVLRYTTIACDPPNQHHLYANVFNAHTDEASAHAKLNFLFNNIDWAVQDNKPLTTLVRKFKGMCYYSLQRPSELEAKVIPLTYEAVLELFDEALADPDWPQNDPALPFKMPTHAATTATQGGSRVTGSRGGGKRELESSEEDDDPMSQPPRKPRIRVPIRRMQNPVAGGV